MNKSGQLQQRYKLNRIRGFFIFATVALVAIYAAVVGLAYFKQEALIFHPVPLADDFKFTVPGVTELQIPVDGAILSALHYKNPNPKGVVYFLHGNSGNLQSWVTSIEFYKRINYDLFMIDFRGFGKSTGHVESEAQLHNDVQAAWQTVAALYADKKMVVFGRSLGTGLAAQFSTKNKADLTVLVSPYFSLKAMADSRYGWLPSFINRYPMRSDEYLPKINNPVMIFHGVIDGTIPFAQGDALSKTKPGVEFIAIPNAGHNDIHQFPVYLETLVARLTGL